MTSYADIQNAVESGVTVICHLTLSQEDYYLPLFRFKSGFFSDVFIFTNVGNYSGKPSVIKAACQIAHSVPPVEEWLYKIETIAKQEYADEVGDEVRSAIAPIEDGTAASQAFAQGAYFFRSGAFCKAKTAIASGDTFTLNTNYETTTVSAELGGGYPDGDGVSY